MKPRHWHQQSFRVGRPNHRTVELVRQFEPSVVAEIGIYEGGTSLELARCLDGRGELHLFDFEPRVRDVTHRLAEAGHTNVVGHGNSDRGLDSYNWSLMQVLREHPEPVFDYVFLDGAHTWPVDALAFCLVDRLLRVGGHVDFDDYAWTLGASPTMKPEVNPDTALLYTDEQIAEAHVALIVDLLVRRDDRYEEVVPDKLFRKIRP
jgi:predicted O-methyltransferase YrrM